MPRRPRGAESDLLPSDRLFRNRGDGTFVDVTEKSGLAKIVGRAGTVWAWQSEIMTTTGNPTSSSLGSDLCALRNRGDGTFEDVTERAGLAGVRDNPTSAAFADLDNDGDLDLYVCHYMVLGPRSSASVSDREGRVLLLRPEQGPPCPGPRLSQ